MFGKDISKKISATFLKAVRAYFRKNFPNESFPGSVEPILQLTREKGHGDLTSNIAMRLASVCKRSPEVIGKDIIQTFHDVTQNTGLSDYVGAVELKGGFINFWLSDDYYRKVLEEIREKKDRFGSSDEGKGRRVNLEYVSANPTGPLTIAHGRQAAVGDALSRILRFSGYDVTNEYYLNDVGRQIYLLGKSVQIRYRGLFGKEEPMPEDGYIGDYVIDIAKEIKNKKGDGLLKKDKKTEGYFREYAVNYMMDMIRDDLSAFGVSFDAWTSQAGLEGRKEVERVLKDLEKKGFVYEKEGAKWFASSRLGDEKDRVVIKSDGSFTYLAPDIAYHRDKYRRGYEKLIDLLGPDHHGYIGRMKAAVQAMGHSDKSLNILIVQLVKLLRGGQAVSMSTRKGEFISLREVIDELGKDVTRFFFLVRRLDSHLEFDIELAKKESSENPVFYIQYAHARICSIHKYSRKKALRLLFQKTDLKLLRAKEERELIRKMIEFPFAVKASAEALEPNRMLVYLNELARLFHSFYTECRVVSDDAALTKARLYLVECVRIVLANGLGLLNITFPEKM
ncbi:MAG: arginine--tRNA ligase [Candidatus Omnitrophota bacterium]|jgi:arginyl-tRNA synthetase